MFGLFRKTEKISSLDDLARFCEAQATNRCHSDIYQFVQSRKDVMPQPEFEGAALEEALFRARWRAYPVVLANVLEMLAVTLRQNAPVQIADVDIETCLKEIASRLMGEAQEEQPFAAHVWQEYASDLVAIVCAALQKPPKPVRDIPLLRVRRFYDLIPLHPDILASEHKAIEAHLCVKLCKAQDKFVRAVDWNALSDDMAKKTSQLTSSPAINTEKPQVA